MKTAAGAKKSGIKQAGEKELDEVIVGELAEAIGSGKVGTKTRILERSSGPNNPGMFEDKNQQAAPESELAAEYYDSDSSVEERRRERKNKSIKKQNVSIQPCCLKRNSRFVFPQLQIN